MGDLIPPSSRFPFPRSWPALLFPAPRHASPVLLLGMSSLRLRAPRLRLKQQPSTARQIVGNTLRQIIGRVTALPDLPLPFILHNVLSAGLCAALPVPRVG